MVVFGWWFEVVPAGWFPVYLPLVVVDFVVAAGAEQTHVVEVGVSLYCPGGDVVGLAPVGGGAASYAGLVTGDEGDPLCGAGGPS